MNDKNLDSGGILCPYCFGKITLWNTPKLILNREEAKILTEHLKNEYLTHEEPARSVLLKIHNFTNKV